MRFLKPFIFLAAALVLAPTSFASQATPPSKTETTSIQVPMVKVYKTAKRPMLLTPQNSGPVEMLEHRNLDQGIYLPMYADGKSMCAAIMSYNFTPGDNPRLESVTTCTPARPHSVYRTNHENRKPPQGPVLQMISSPQSSSPK